MVIRIHKQILTSLLGAIFFLLSGCATVGNIDKGLQVLKAQSIETAASFLGDPDNYVEMPNSKIYTWVNIENVNVTLPNTHTGGYSTSRSAEYPGVSDVVTAYGTKTDRYRFNCKLTFRTNMEGIITATKVEGHAIGCWDYKKTVSKILQENRNALARDVIEEEGQPSF